MLSGIKVVRNRMQDKLRDSTGAEAHSRLSTYTSGLVSETEIHSFVQQRETVPISPHPKEATEIPSLSK